LVGVAVNVTLVPAQITLSASLDIMLTLAGRFGLTVVVIGIDVASDAIKHGVAFDIITTVTTSLFVNAAVVYVALVAPTISLPFSFHWYDGDVPPLVGVAVNVTLVPAQIVLFVAFDTMLTLAGRFGLTMVVIPFDVAGEPVKHGVAFDIITTVTTSLFVNAAVVYVALVAPTISLPFSFHWYDGDVPPLVGVAVNVTLVPAQIVLFVAFDTMLTLAGRFGFTVTDLLTLLQLHCLSSKYLLQ